VSVSVFMSVMLEHIASSNYCVVQRLAAHLLCRSAALDICVSGCVWVRVCSYMCVMASGVCVSVCAYVSDAGAYGFEQLLCCAAACRLMSRVSLYVSLSLYVSVGVSGSGSVLICV
jgi:hypothetical protein